MSDNIAEPMDDNTALREILGELRLLDSAIRVGYDTVDGENAAAVTAEAPYTRATDADIVKTVITNVHATNEVRVFEGGFLVGILAPGDTWESPLAGAGEISVTTEVEATIAIATYRKE